VKKHITRLGLYSATDYVEWCRARGFGTDLRKSWAELEKEWCAYGRELARARRRCQVDRDPEKLLAGVCCGTVAARDIARPRWRALAERIERAELTDPAREALRAVVEIVCRRGNLLLAEGRFGDRLLPFVDGLLSLAQHHELWIREPRDWRPRSHNARRQFTSLVRHLVAKYPVPGFLDAAWLRDDDDALRYRDWFVMIGKGRNIRDAWSPVPLTTRIVHHMLRAPETYAVEHALRWGQVHAFGGHERLLQAVVGTRLGRSFENEDFWITVIRWFVAHPEVLPRHFGPVVDYLQHQRFESEEVFVAPGQRETRPPQRPNLSMKSRKSHALMREVERWHRSLSRSISGKGLFWERCGIGELVLETGKRGKNLQIWRIRELLSSHELRHEGAVMHHCVATYARICTSQACSVWTLEVESYEGVQKRATVEVRSGDLVTQCRGKCNKDPSAKEREMIRRWATQEGLAIAKYALPE
jgi:hypothetical protein